MRRRDYNLLSAVSRGDIDKVRRLVLEGAKLSLTGLRPLQLACEKRYNDLALFLVENGAPISKETFYCAYENRLSISTIVEMITRSPRVGSFALLHACKSDHVKLERVLIGVGANVNIADKFRRLLLLAACERSNVKISHLMIDAGADINTADEFGNFPLLAACENGDIEIAKVLINAEADVKRTGEFGRSPLLAACENDAEIVKLLIDAGADVNGADELGRFPLLAACQKSDMQIVKLLILAGAEVKKVDENEMFALLAACECETSEVEIVELLIAAGAEVNRADAYEKFPLLAACRKNDVKTAKLLIDAGANIRKTDKFGAFPLLVACEERAIECVKLLIDAGIDIKEADELLRRFPLMLTACQKSDVYFAKTLIEAGVDVNQEANDIFKRVPLLEACEQNNVEVVKILIDAGAHVNTADVYGNFPLLVACDKSAVEIVKILINKGANCTKEDVYGMFPLLTACEKGNYEIVRILINAGADINKRVVHGVLPWLVENDFGCAKNTIRLIDAGADASKADKLGKTPLLAACEIGSIKIANLLIDAGADVNKADVSGIVPLIPACERGDFEMAKLLINAGVDASKAYKLKRSPLLVSSERGYVEIAKLLIDAGGDVNEADEFGNVPLLAACRNGHIKFVKMLINAGANVYKANKAGRTALYTACTYGHYSIGVMLTNFFTITKRSSDSDESILKVILKRHRLSTEISRDAITLVRMIVTRSPFLTNLRYEGDYLFHELPCPVKLQRVLVGVWVQYRYRELYAQGTTKPNAVKICLIGEARAGKTTLIKSLRDVDWKDGGDDRRTASVDVTKTNVKSMGELVFCDFAGQPFFHKTHGLFFSTSSTIFLLVVDVTLDDEKLRRSSHYWISFVKCSVSLSGKAYVLVIGSRKDLLPQSSLTTAQMRISSLVAYLKSTFGRWFNFSENSFVLNCRQRRSIEISLLWQTLRKVKSNTLKAAEKVPSIVETAKEHLLPLLRNVGYTKISLLQRVISFISSTVSNSHRLAQEVRENISFVLRSHGIFNGNQMSNVRFINADVFKSIMLESVCAGFSEQVQSLLVEFLQATGEILVIGDTVILDPPWLCQSVVGPLLSPKDFPIHLDFSLSGTANKENIQSVLEIFNKQKWVDVDHTISLLRRLEICYLVSEQTETYQFPALIEEQRPPHAWRENPEMTVYVGRRLMSEEITDIITPGTMPFIQSSARNASCFRPLEPIVWQGGILIKRTIGSHFVEGMIAFQDREKAIDFIVRGPEHSEQQCMKHLRDLMDVGIKVLLVKSPGTTRTLWYISRTELVALKDFPLAHKSQIVEETIKISQFSSAKVHQKGIEDTLKDLLALPHDHFTFIPCEALCTVSKLLDKDTEGRSALVKRLPGFSSVDRHHCETAKQILTRWSERLEARTSSFVDIVQEMDLLYVLAILNDSSVIELSDKKKRDAQKDLTFLEENSASAIAASRRTRMAVERPTDFTDSASELYFDMPVTKDEIIEAAKRIPAEWRRIGRILGPEPTFREYHLDECETERELRDRAQKMLNKWTEKHGVRATRRHLIEAMIKENLKARISEIFLVANVSDFLPKK
ncbi:uncharacterized protein [Oscarella lobularis]|uniref:uncharacterized protein isoform X2 n=1 Tax=Oscarella lobularis TaxID=121494 RepID=UPI0033141414